MRHLALVTIVPLVTACNVVDDAVRIFQGLTNPLVAEGLVLNVDPPSGIDVAGYEPGAAVSIFLADAASAADLERAPISNATVTVDLGADDAPVPSQGQGAYAAGPLDYDAGGSWVVHVAIGGDEATATVSLPSPPSFSVPATHDVSTALSVPVSGGFDGLLAVVVDDGGEVTWSNEPKGIREVYDFTHGQAPTAVEIPATAFPAAGAYAVGIAGMRFTKADDLTQMNTALSTLMAGSMHFEPTVAQ